MNNKTNYQFTFQSSLSSPDFPHQDLTNEIEKEIEKETAEVSEEEIEEEVEGENADESEEEIKEELEGETLQEFDYLSDFEEVSL